MDNKNLYIYKDGEYHKTAGLDSEQVLALIKGLIGTEIKVGYYAMNEESTKYEYIGEEVPEDYNGSAILVDSDGYTYLLNFEDGEMIRGLDISANGVGIQNYQNDEDISYSTDGASKLNFFELTHSFNDLDETLKSIVETAISSNQPQSCTQAQWDVIKALLDKSLYFYINGYTLIKCMAQADDSYIHYLFWGRGGNYGASIEFEYSLENKTLAVEYSEI